MEGRLPLQALLRTISLFVSVVKAKVIGVINGRVIRDTWFVIGNL